MKKGLSLILAIAMVFSMFASVAFAAETKTPEQMFEALKAKGIFTGYDDGSAGLEKTMTRAQVSVVLVKLLNLTEDKASASVFTDLKGAEWAEGYIGAAVKAKLMLGVGGGKFNPSGVFTTEQLAAVLVRALGIAESTDAVEGKVSNWAKGSVAAAIKAGLITASADYAAAAPRSILVAATYVADQSIESANKLTATVKQVGAKKLEVTFNKAAAADLTVGVIKGFVPVDGKVTFSADRKVATFEADAALDGDYKVEVKGLDAIAVKAAKEEVTSIEITTKNLQEIITSQDIKYTALNQFKETIVVTNTKLNASVFNITDGKNYTATKGENKLSITTADGYADAGAGDAKKPFALNKDEKVLVSLIYTSGSAPVVSAQATLDVVAKAVASKVELGTVAPLKDKTRITKDEERLVLPIKLFDQYNNELALNADNLAAVRFLSSGAAVVVPTGAVTVAADKDANDFGLVTEGDVTKLEFTAKATGTVTITAFIPATASQSSTSVTIVDAPALKSVAVEQPSGLVVAGEEIEVKYTGKDTYDAAKKLSAGTGASGTGLIWFSNNDAVALTDIKVDANGKLTVKPTKEGVATINAYLNGALQGTIVLDVKAAAVPEKIVGLKAGTVTQFVYNGAYTYAAKDFNVVDQYNRTIKDDDLKAAFSMAKKDNTKTSVTVSTYTVTGTTTNGEETLTATYAGKTFDFKVTTVAASAIVDYDVAKPANLTLFDGGTTKFTTVGGADKYAATFELKSGLDKDGKKIAVPTGLDLTSSDTTAVEVSGSKVFAKQNNKEVAVTVVKGGKLVATVTFKTSDATPVPTSVSFKDAITEVTTSTEAAKLDLSSNLVIVDQYGVDVTATAKGAGKWYTSDSAILDVTTAGVVSIDADFSGEKDVTITFVTANAKIVTLNLKVKK